MGKFNKVLFMVVLLIVLAFLMGQAGSMADTYNVKTQYGATGDGVTDDRQAITNAINAANSAGGGTVYVPNGTYYISNTLIFRSNVTIQGDGWSSIIKATGNYPAIQAIGESNIVVRDLAITGSASTSNTSNFGVYFCNSSTKGLISNVYTNGCYRGIELANTTLSTVKNCYIDNDKSSLGAIDISTSENCTVDSCTVVGATGVGIDIREGGASGLGQNHVINCHVTGCSVGIVVSGAGIPGVSLPRCTIIGNTVVNSTNEGIWVENGASETRVIGNSVKSSGTVGIGVAKGTGDAPAYNIIQGNIIGNSGTNGIQSYLSWYTTISGNQISVFGLDGIRVNGPSGSDGHHVISNNIVNNGTSTTGAAIRVYEYANATSVTGNTCFENNGYGIRIESSTGCIITGNTVMDSDKTGVLDIGGISIDGSSHRTVVSANTSRRQSGTKQDYGVDILSGAQRCMIIGNELFQNTTAAYRNNGTLTTLVYNITN